MEDLSPQNSLAILSGRDWVRGVRLARYKVADEGVYYLRSRVTDGVAGWTEGEREYLWGLVERASGFSGVEVLERVVLEREVQLLVRVDPRRRGEEEDAELVRRYRLLYGEARGFLGMDATRLEQRLAEGDEWAENLRERLGERMHDISAFMKTLKQRFTSWYNRRHERQGVLWQNRFDSSLLQGEDGVIAYYRAFLWSAPVRAEESEDPADYRWCTASGKGRKWWEVLLTPAEAEFASRVDPFVQELLLVLLRPYISAHWNRPRPPPPRWPAHLCRGHIVGRPEFVREHTRRWRGQDTSVPLRDLAEEARLCAARPCRNRPFFG